MASCSVEHFDEALKARGWQGAVHPLFLLSGVNINWHSICQQFKARLNISRDHLACVLSKLINLLYLDCILEWNFRGVQGMSKIIYEKGKVIELGEHRSLPNGGARYFTHIELERDDQSRVRLESVAVTTMATPKLREGIECTIAFMNQNFRLVGSNETFRNLMLGYASEDSYGVVPSTPASKFKEWKITCVVCALAILWILAHGLSPWMLLGIPAIGLPLVIAPLYFRAIRGNSWAEAVNAKFKELGYTDRAATVYS